MMSQRREPAMRRIIIVIAFLMSWGMTVPQAEARSLFQIRSEQYNAENERDRLQNELQQLQASRQQIVQGLTTDQGMLTTLQTQRAAKVAQLNSWVPSFPSTQQQIQADIQAIDGNITSTQTRINEAQAMLQRITDIPTRITELEQTIATLQTESTVPQQRFDSFMNCYQLALSMKVFNKFAQGQAGVGHANMEQNIRGNVMWKKYQDVYLKYFRADLTDDTYARLEQSVKKSLQEVGAQFFSGDRMALGGGLQSQYDNLLNSGQPVSNVCNAMRDVVNTGEKVFWADNASMTHAPFTRYELPQVSVPDLPSRSIVQ